MPTFIIVIAIVILVVLAAVACYMQYQVKKMEAKKAEQQRELDKLKEDHQEYLNSSIQILAQGIIDDQLTLTEGAIRISVLLDNLDINEQQRESYSVFFQLAEAAAHIPILDAWKKLSKKEKLRFEKERKNIEDQYKDFMIDAANRIRGTRF